MCYIRAYRVGRASLCSSVAGQAQESLVDGVPEEAMSDSLLSTVEQTSDFWLRGLPHCKMGRAVRTSSFRKFGPSERKLLSDRVHQ